MLSSNARAVPWHTYPESASSRPKSVSMRTDRRNCREISTAVANLRSVPPCSRLALRIGCPQNAVHGLFDVLKRCTLARHLPDTCLLNPLDLSVSQLLQRDEA